MWNKIELKDHAFSKEFMGYRVVENQEYISTRNLVDTNHEHDLLEEMLEKSKPPKPVDCPINDYLLYTPFRYPPLRGATRFGKITERSPFYGSEELRAAFAEVAHRIDQFDQDTSAKFPNRNLSYTSFKFAAKAQLYLDLLNIPFDRYKAEIHSLESYPSSHTLGTEMRNAGIQASIFESTRCPPPPAKNIVIFDPSIFTKKSFYHQQWACMIGQTEITFVIGREKKFSFFRGAQEA